MRLALADATLTIQFEGRLPCVSLQPQELLAGTSNYIVGRTPAQWRKGVLNYGRVRAVGLYPGIDAVYYGSGGKLEYDLNVAPGGDPGRVQLRFSGHRSLSMNSKGDLIIHLQSVSFLQRVPNAYQIVDGQRERVQASYEITGPSTVRLRVARFDRSKPLTVDPVLSYSTYLGSFGADQAYGLALDSDGNAYIAGITDSGQLQTTSGAFQTGFRGLTDAFVTKLNRTLTAAVFTTYYGGSLNEGANGVAVDGDGNVFIAGTTQSSDLPTTPGSFQTTYRGGHGPFDPSIMGDAFVAKFDKTGTKLIYATYVGGTQAETLFGLALDPFGNAIITGATLSDNFPISANAYQAFYHGNTDGFVAKLNSSGTDVVFSTFLGGRDRDGPERIATDAAGDIFIAGTTLSPDFPTTPGAYQTAAAGGPDAFAIKFDPQGNLIFSTRLGSSALDQGRSIAVDGGGNVYLLGQTEATSGFPITPGAAQAQYGGGISDGFIAKFDPTGSRLLYCTFFGGEGIEQDGGVIVVDASGNAYVTQPSTSVKFPVTADALQPKSGGGTDALIGVLNPSGTAFAYASFLGGSALDVVTALVLDRAQNLYLAGYTASHDFPIVNGSLHPAYFGGADDAFLAKLQFVTPQLTLDSNSVSFAAVAGGQPPAPQTVRISSSGDSVSFTVSVSPLAPWLSVSSASNVTPANLTLTVDPHNLSPGNYSTVVTVAAAASNKTTANITVTLVVSPNENPAITAEGIVNAATFLGGPIAPGLIITLFGSHLGPADLAGAQLGSDGRLATLVAGTRVLFDGQAAPLVYVSAEKVSAIVPYGVGRNTSTQVQVQHESLWSNSVSLSVAASSPGIFTAASSGVGQAVVFNQDGSLNSPSNPAEKDTIVVLYATGEGETVPAGLDGQLAIDVYPKPLAPVVLRVGNQIAELPYAGAAPGFTAGLMQINARVPLQAPSGVVPLVLVVGANSSPAGVTIAIK
ncbi:MAG: SBBP repeat-containing protein [Acidobacteriia bacterium]|nr:SBBP repeat-containing protein [Terriglobia bacterium]